MIIIVFIMLLEMIVKIKINESYYYYHVISNNGRNKNNNCSDDNKYNNHHIDSNDNDGINYNN